MSSELSLAAHHASSLVKENASQEVLFQLCSSTARSYWKLGIQIPAKGEFNGPYYRKYGMRFFAGSGMLKGMKAYRDLKEQITY